MFRLSWEIINAPTPSVSIECVIDVAERREILAYALLLTLEICNIIFFWGGGRGAIHADMEVVGYKPSEKKKWTAIPNWQTM